MMVKGYGYDDYGDDDYDDGWYDDVEDEVGDDHDDVDDGEDEDEVGEDITKWFLLFTNLSRLQEVVPLSI